MIKYPYFLWEVKTNVDEKIKKGKIICGKPLLSITIDSLPIQNNRLIGLGLKRFSKIYSIERDKVLNEHIIMNKILTTTIGSIISRGVLKLVKL